MDYKKYLGNWANTLQTDNMISRFRLFEENGAVMIETEVAGGTEPWGTAPIRLFGLPQDPDKITAFDARYDLRETEHYLCINDSKGLLVVAGFHSGKAAAGNLVFTREFFYKD